MENFRGLRYLEPHRKENSRFHRRINEPSLISVSILTGCGSGSTTTTS